MRVAAVREIGLQAQRADREQQIRLTEQLATQIRTEPDPLVRLAIQESIAEFSVPLARQVLLAGLQDEDLDVRVVEPGSVSLFPIAPRIPTPIADGTFPEHQAVECVPCN